MTAHSISDLLRQARTDKAAAPAKPADEVDDAAEEYVCYAKLRGPRQLALMLELRMITGDCDSFDYGLLGRCTFNRSSGITLFFANGKVIICGKNLRPLFEGIQAHRVLWAGVATAPKEMSRDPDATVVTSIEVEAG